MRLLRRQVVKAPNGSDLLHDVNLNGRWRKNRIPMPRGIH